MAKNEPSQEEPQARSLRRELFTDDYVDELLKRVDERGVALTGEGEVAGMIFHADRGRQLSATVEDCPLSDG